MCSEPWAQATDYVPFLTHRPDCDLLWFAIVQGVLLNKDEWFPNLFDFLKDIADGQVRDCSLLIAAAPKAQFIKGSP